MQARGPTRPEACERLSTSLSRHVVRNHKLARISARSEILFLTFVESCRDGEGEILGKERREKERERSRNAATVEYESAVEASAHNYAPIVASRACSREKRDFTHHTYRGTSFNAADRPRSLSLSFRRIFSLSLSPSFLREARAFSPFPGDSQKFPPSQPSSKKGDSKKLLPEGAASALSLSLLRPLETHQESTADLAVR